ncbi:MAG: hypothetical protein ACK4NX_01330, partial [Candidatus Paceibacteria bacterium]
MARLLSEPTQTLLSAITQAQNLEEEMTGEKIHVSSVTRGLGFFYEKIRNALDYHEEHLWMKNAIYRILKRRYYEILGGKKIGRAMLEELVRAHYLENDSIPEEIADIVDNTIFKYREALYILQETHKSDEQEAKLRKLELWFLGIAAAEIEELLNQDRYDESFISFFYRSMKERLAIDLNYKIQDKDLQIYLASYRNFLLADEDMESYTLFRLYFQEWENPDQAFIQNIGKELPQIKEKIESMLRQPARKNLDRIFKRRSLLVSLLKDIILQDPQSARSILEDPDELEAKLRELYETKYRLNRARLQRSAIRAIIFIFLTKVLLAFIAEIPYELVHTGDINFWVLGLNTFLPPLILVGVAATIRMPGEEQNILQLIVDFEKLILRSDSPVVLDILRPKKQRPIVMQTILIVFYLFHFAITFFILSWFFKALHFNWLSGLLFILFLSLVSFFALRLRKTANELVAIEEKESAFRTILDFLTFPFVEVGRLLSYGLRSINVVALIFDFLIEAPFQTFVEILEEWFSFLR